MPGLQVSPEDTRLPTGDCVSPGMGFKSEPGWTLALELLYGLNQIRGDLSGSRGLWRVRFRSGSRLRARGRNVHVALGQLLALYLLELLDRTSAFAFGRGCDTQLHAFTRFPVMYSQLGRRCFGDPVLGCSVRVMVAKYYLHIVTPSPKMRCTISCKAPLVAEEARLARARSRERVRASSFPLEKPIR